MIDWIFFSEHMKTVGYLGPFSQEWLVANRVVAFPHPRVPSDHIPLVVEVELTSGVNRNR